MEIRNLGVVKFAFSFQGCPLLTSCVMLEELTPPNLSFFIYKMRVIMGGTSISLGCFEVYITDLSIKPCCRISQSFVLGVRLIAEPV